LYIVNKILKKKIYCFEKYHGFVKFNSVMSRRCVKPLRKLLRGFLEVLKIHKDEKRRKEMKLKKRTADCFLKILMVFTALFLVQCDSRQDIFFPLENFTDDPVFSPVGGTYSSDQSVAISCSTPGAAIYYTTDGSNPSAASALYTAAIPVAGHGTGDSIRAIAISPGIMNSNIIQNNYQIKYAAADPVLNIPGGLHNSDKVVTITCSTPGAVIYYTTDGSTPTAASAVYSTAIDVSGNGTNCTLSALAVVTGWTDSAVVSNTYNIRYVIYFVSGDKIYISSSDGAVWDDFDKSGLLTGIYASGNKIFTGGANTLYYSPDGGVTWDSKAYTREMTDVYFLGNTVYFSNNNGGGLMYSSTNGDTWMGPSLGVDQRSVQATGDILFLSTNQGVYFSRDAGSPAVFVHSSGPVASPITVTEGILSDNTFDACELGGDIYIASDSGVSVYHTGTLTVDNYTVIEGLASNQVNGISSDGTMIYAATDGGLSVYNGTTWNTVISSIVCNRVRAIGSVVYAATDNGIYISRDQGATWTNYYGGCPVLDIHAASRP